MLNVFLMYQWIEFGWNLSGILSTILHQIYATTAQPFHTQHRDLEFDLLH